MKVSAQRLDQEKGPLTSGHKGRACFQELEKFMGARRLELQQQGKEDSETRISTLSICVYHTVFQITSASMILYVPELLWLKKGAFICAIKTEQHFSLHSLSSPDFFAKEMPPAARGPRHGGHAKN